MYCLCLLQLCLAPSKTFLNLLFVLRLFGYHMVDIRYQTEWLIEITHVDGEYWTEIMYFEHQTPIILAVIHKYCANKFSIQFSTCSTCAPSSYMLTPHIVISFHCQCKRNLIWAAIGVKSHYSLLQICNADGAVLRHGCVGHKTAAKLASWARQMRLA